MAHVNISYVYVQVFVMCKIMIMTLFDKLIMWLTLVIKVLRELIGKSFSSPYYIECKVAPCGVII